MNTIKSLLILVLFTVFSCSPPMEKETKPIKQIAVDTTKTDTIETISLIDLPDYDTINIVITSGGILVNSNTINTDYTESIKTLSLKLNDYNQPIYIKVNDAVLLAAKDRYELHYTYMDDNTIIVQKDNTISEIINDHKKMGYDITHKSLMACNPYLNKKGRVIQPGDIIKLVCK